MTSNWEEEHFSSYVRTKLSSAVDLLESGLQGKNKAWLEEAHAELSRLMPFDPASRKLLIRCLEALVLVDSANALKYLEEALEVDGDDPTVLNNLGYIHQKQRGDYKRATFFYKKCLDVAPSFVQGYLGLADVYQGLGVPELQQSLLRKGFAECQDDPASNLALLSLALGTVIIESSSFRRLAEADHHLRKACASFRGCSNNPALSRALTTMAKGEVLRGRPHTALDLFGEALKLSKDNHQAVMGILDIGYRSPDEFKSRFQQATGMSLEDSMKETDKAGLDSEALENLSRKLLPATHVISPPRRNTNPNHTMRVGYLLHAKVPKELLQPLLCSKTARLFTYSTDLHSPGFGSGNHRTIRDLPADIAAQVIRQDELDILVDLIGLSGGARPDVLSLSPATAVVTYNELSARLGTTSALKLPAPGVLHPGAALNPSINASIKSKKSGTTVFTVGYLGPLSDLSQSYLVAVVALLKNFPSVRALFMNPVFCDATTKQGFLDRFPEKLRARVLCMPHEDSSEKRLPLYRVLDVFLVPWPACSILNLLEAMLMNVPPMTMRPPIMTQRPCGADLISSVGLPVAKTAEEMIMMTMRLEKTGREDVREAILGSPLVDAGRFVRDFEKCLIEAWVCSR
jgi:tetratricopeptide (TPR) repeat protein